MARNIFNTVAMNHVGSSRFNLSHDVKMSFKMGYLIPSCVIDVIPGDRFRMGVENLLRFAPLVSPVMHKVNITTHYFFVPNRILWPDFPKWIIGEVTADPPNCNMTGLAEGQLGDYMGLVPGMTDNSIDVNALPFAAYAKIYDEYYRDQNLQTTEKFTQLVPGENAWVSAMAKVAPLRRSWQHDYFTSSLPDSQFGDPVTLPLLENDTVDVTIKPGSTNPSRIRVAADGSNPGNTGLRSGTDGLFETNANIDVQLDPNGNLEVDIMGQVTDINTLRRAFRLQEWLERSMRGGRRYIEQMMSHFGQRSSDARLDRPEYIGGSRQNMVISEVLSSAETVNSSDVTINPVGQMAGHGISVGGGNSWNYTCEEHGWIIGIINVQPVTAYQDGMARKFYRPDKLDYAWPSFANIGEQPVYRREIYCKGTGGHDTVFGYVPRYAEYKFESSRVAGTFRSSLDHWHLGRKFDAPPVLDGSFIECGSTEDDLNRIFADTTGDQIYAHIFNNINVIRKLPMYGIPTI